MERGPTNLQENSRFMGGRYTSSTSLSATVKKDSLVLQRGRMFGASAMKSEVVMVMAKVDRLQTPLHQPLHGGIIHFLVTPTIGSKAV